MSSVAEMLKLMRAKHDDLKAALPAADALYDLTAEAGPAVKLWTESYQQNRKFNQVYGAREALRNLARFGAKARNASPLAVEVLRDDSTHFWPRTAHVTPRRRKLSACSIWPLSTSRLPRHGPHSRRRGRNAARRSTA